MSARHLVFFILWALPALGQDLPTRSASRDGIARSSLSLTDQQISILQNRIRKEPTDFTAYDELGSTYFQKARETGDITYYDLSDKTLYKALELTPPDFRQADPLVHMAQVCMGEHRFTDALTYTQKAIGLGSGNLAAFALEGDAYTDLGSYEDAAIAYGTAQALGAMTATPLATAYMTDSRVAYLRFLRSDPKGSIALMKSAINAALQTDVPRENLAWLYFEMGERYFQMGDLPSADLSYGSGITADPNHYRSIAGLAKVRAAQGKLEESVQLYEQSIAIIPFPVYIEELGNVYKKMARTKEAQQEYELVEYIGHLSALNRVLANRELAMFYADQGIKLEEALDLARRELDVRHDVYTWDTLAWVLFKNGKLQEASDAMSKALALQTQDPLFQFHAGMIYHSLGRDSEAEKFLSTALKTNPHFDVLDPEAANRTLNEISHTRVGSGATNDVR